MNNIISIFIFSAFLISGASANELEDRQIINDKVHTLFFSNNYSELNNLASSYLREEQRTSSGLWKLTLFYGGVKALPNEHVTTNNYWNDLESRSRKWIKFNPKSPTGHLAYASILLKHAWMFRGSGWGYQVRKEDWKPFHEYIEKARVVLEETKKISALDPEWYVLMIDVATAQGWESDKFQELMKEANKKYPYFYQIHFEAINYLTPKWHGSKEDIEKFANEITSLTNKKEKSGMYSRIYWVASQYNYGNDLFTKSSVVWNKMSQSINDVIEQYPDQWNINNFAYFSCLAGDIKQTRKLIKLIEEKPIIEAWKDIDFYTQCKKFSEKQPETFHQPHRNNRLEPSNLKTIENSIDQSKHHLLKPVRVDG